MFKRILTSLVMILVGFSLSTLVHAAPDDYVSSRAYFEDASNSLTFLQVKDRAFTDYPSFFIPRSSADRNRANQTDFLTLLRNVE